MTELKACIKKGTGYKFSDFHLKCRIYCNYDFRKKNLVNLVRNEVYTAPAPSQFTKKGGSDGI